MSALRIIFAAAALTALSSAMIAFWPVHAPRIATIEFNRATAETASDAYGFQSLATRFERSGLPEPAPPEPQETETASPPPPDPADALRRYRYLGMADSDGRGAAVFESGGVTQILKPGDLLEGFTLAAFNGESAVFEREDREIRLSLSEN